MAEYTLSDPTFALPTEEQVAKMTTEELVEAVERGEAEINATATTIIQQMMRVGCILWFKRVRTPHGLWGKWCADNLTKVLGYGKDSAVTASRRIAIYKHYWDKADLPKTQAEALEAIAEAKKEAKHYEDNQPESDPNSPPTNKGNGEGGGKEETGTEKGNGDGSGKEEAGQGEGEHEELTDAEAKELDQEAGFNLWLAKVGCTLAQLEQIEPVHVQAGQKVRIGNKWYTVEPGIPLVISVQSVAAQQNQAA